MNLDRIDYGILATLQQDARISNKDLATANGISPSTCLERVRRLRSVGAIRGFRADLDPQALGIEVQAMVSVQLAQHARISFDVLLEELLAIEEVINVYLLAGAQDFLLHVAVRDVQHLRSVVQQFTSRDDVAHIETSLVFEYARAAGLPNYCDVR